MLAAAAAGSRELLLSRDIQLSQQTAPPCQLLLPHAQLPSFTSANVRPQLQSPLLLPQLHCTVAQDSDLKLRWRAKWCAQLLQICRFERGNLDDCKRLSHINHHIGSYTDLLPSKTSSLALKKSSLVLQVDSLSIHRGRNERKSLPSYIPDTATHSEIQHHQRHQGKVP